jgi:hypothetical protein
MRFEVLMAIIMLSFTSWVLPLRGFVGRYIDLEIRAASKPKTSTIKMDNLIN